MPETRMLSASMEDYLEAIFHIVSEKQAVRAKDIAKPEGNRLAQDIIRRHEALLDFFVRVLFIDPDEAEKAACEMEHAVSRTILDRLIRFMEFVEFCPKSGENWIREFWNRCETVGEHGREPYENCEACITQCLKNLKKKKALTKRLTKTPLKKMKSGQKGKILRIRERSGVAKRMAEMDVSPGSIIEVENISPSGDLYGQILIWHYS